jgi:hypothetical protein
VAGGAHQLGLVLDDVLFLLLPFLKKKKTAFCKNKIGVFIVFQIGGKRGPIIGCLY